MNTLITITLFKSLMIFIFLGLSIIAYFFTEHFVSKLLSRNYYITYGINPLFRLFKLLIKQEGIPQNAVSATFFQLIPPLNLLFALIPITVLPLCEPYFFAGSLQTSEIFSNTHGVIFFFAFSSTAILTVLWSGWLTQKNIPIISCMRAAYREISCKIPLLMIVLSMVLFYRSSHLHQIITYQTHHSWGIVQQPLAAVIFFVALLAEIGKAPFDTAESLHELGGGYLSEYSGIQTFFMLLAEYVNLIIFTIIFIHLFLGGYQPFIGLEQLAESYPAFLFAIQGFSLLFKIIGLVALYTILKLALPRFRHNDLMTFGQKGLLPFSFLNLLIVISSQFFRQT